MINLKYGLEDVTIIAPEDVKREKKNFDLDKQVKKNKQKGLDRQDICARNIAVLQYFFFLCAYFFKF